MAEIQVTGKGGNVLRKFSQAKMPLSLQEMSTVNVERTNAIVDEIDSCGNSQMKPVQVLSPKTDGHQQKFYKCEKGIALLFNFIRMQ